MSCEDKSKQIPESSYVQTTEPKVDVTNSELPIKKRGIHPWVWGGLLFWGAVFGMNAHFLTQAIQASPEMVVDNYYEKGLVHDQTLTEKKAWENSGLEVELIKKSDAWIVKLNKHVDQVSGQLYRAANKKADIEAHPALNTDELIFNRPTLKGDWQLNLRVNHKNQWMTYTQRLTH